MTTMVNLKALLLTLLSKFGLFRLQLKILATIQDGVVFMQRMKVEKFSLFFVFLVNLHDLYVFLCAY